MRVKADRDPRSVKSREADPEDHDWIVGVAVARAALIGVGLFYLEFGSVSELVSSAGHNALCAGPGHSWSRSRGGDIPRNHRQLTHDSSQIGSCDTTPVARRLTMPRKSEHIICRHHAAQNLGTRQADVDRANRMRPIRQNDPLSSKRGPNFLFMVRGMIYHASHTSPARSGAHWAPAV
jgi:hypothetical protein